MDISDQIDLLLEENAWVVDVLPEQVPAERGSRYAMFHAHCDLMRFIMFIFVCSGFPYFWCLFNALSS